LYRRKILGSLREIKPDFFFFFYNIPVLRNCKYEILSRNEIQLSSSYLMHLPSSVFGFICVKRGKIPKLVIQIARNWTFFFWRKMCTKNVYEMQPTGVNFKAGRTEFATYFNLWGNTPSGKEKRISRFIR